MTSIPLTRACLTLGCLLVFVTAALAQSQATTGNIEGRVIDPQGAIIPDVTVTATNKDTVL